MLIVAASCCEGIHTTDQQRSFPSHLCSPAPSLPTMPALAPGDYISIIGTSYTAVRKLVDIVKSIKNAPKEIRAIKREAVFVAHLLGSIRGEESQKPSTPKFWPLVEEMAETLQGDVDKFVAKVTKAKLDNGGIRRALWPAYASEAKDLTKLLKEFHATVGAAYSVGVYETLYVFDLEFIAC